VRRGLCAAALGLLLALGCGGGDGDAPAPDVAPPSAAELRRIAGRVERIRGLRFDRLPEVETVTVETLGRRLEADLERDDPPAERRVDELVLRLTGILRPQDDLEALLDVDALQPLGVYDPRRERLTLIERPANSDPVTREITLAHELLHALEDQRFGLPDETGMPDERDLSLKALAEGTAVVVHERYAAAHIDPGEIVVPPEGVPSRDDVPPLLGASLDLSYVHGPAFVQALLNEAGGGWRLVNRAWRDRPPVSSEQILHPRAYLADDRPEGVALRVGGILRGAGWRRLSTESVGQLDAVLLLRAGEGDGPGGLVDYARGWEGGAAELWSRAPADEACAAPCTAHTALAIGFRWETPADAAQFAADMRTAVARRLRGIAAGAGAWRSRGGAVAVAAGTTTTGVAFAPGVPLARRLAAAAGG